MVIKLQHKMMRNELYIYIMKQCTNNPGKQTKATKPSGGRTGSRSSYESPTHGDEPAAAAAVYGKEFWKRVEQFYGQHNPEKLRPVSQSHPLRLPSTTHACDVRFILHVFEGPGYGLHVKMILRPQ